ncbi:chemotaxis protein CheW [Natrinema salinisoli]|uniref:chemotaxis protein CheW n=1 Tax=Natrinema salinisoli TaxID=2878535 RepID=UPI001CF02D00|nr:chemotaxis protein CheW [Natrinema salinisoli]
MGTSSNGNGTDTGVSVKILMFGLEGTQYCVRAESTASVLEVTDGTSLADADDPWNAGTITVAGELVRVVDLPRIFGSTSRTSARVDDPKLLVFSVTDDDGRYYGWLVDDVDVTRTVRTASLEAPRLDTSHVKGRLDIDGEEVLWLDQRAIHA